MTQEYLGRRARLRVQLVAGLVIALVSCQPFSADRNTGNQAGAAGQEQGGSDAGSDAGGDSGGVSSGGADGGSSNSGAGVGGSAGATAGGSAGLSGASSAGAPPSECPCAAPTPTCEAGKCIVRGPKMAKTTSFYTDSTEVTAAQYAAFLKAKGKDTSGQAAECAWNDDYEPLFLQGAGIPKPQEPVTNVDFCDAAAFCSWADKRLCGRISGGPLTLPELADVAQSQWFAACSGPKGQLYPYGAAPRNGACNDGTSSQALAEVRSYSQCQGYYPGLFDMLGNAQEWTDACNGKAGKLDGCERIGGSYKGTGVCSESSLAQRNLQVPELGFRCCSK